MVTAATLPSRTLRVRNRLLNRNLSGLHEMRRARANFLPAYRSGVFGKNAEV
jgi:hypothetical protein